VVGGFRRSGAASASLEVLVDASDGCHLWSDRYERRVDDVFAAQDQLTEAIMEGMREQLAQLRHAGSAGAR
jgi:TolB-like protein